MYKPNLVYLEGQVTYPGVYKILENQTTLTDIIAQAGGFLPNASLADATVSRQSGNEEADPEYERLKQLSRADMTDDEYDYIKSKSRQRKGRLVVDFGSLFNKNSAEENIILRNNDLIQVPEQRDYITIIGQVVEPGKIPYKQGLNIEDYITLAGGYAWRALKKDVRLVKANTGEWVDADDVEAIQPGDIIWVPEDPPPPRFWDLITKTLNIVGQVATVVAATVAVIVATR
jgi:protein involved in polysaccharide export with SLBB domain